MEILWKSNSTRNKGAEGYRDPLSPSLTAGITHTKSNQRRARSDPSDDEHSENSSLHKAPKVPRIENIDEIIWRQIEVASQQLRKDAEPCSLRTSDLPLRGNHFLSLP